MHRLTSLAALALALTYGLRASAELDPKRGEEPPFSRAIESPAIPALPDGEWKQIVIFLAAQMDSENFADREGAYLVTAVLLRSLSERARASEDGMRFYRSVIVALKAAADKYPDAEARHRVDDLANTTDPSIRPQPQGQGYGGEDSGAGVGPQVSIGPS